MKTNVKCASAIGVAAVAIAILAALPQALAVPASDGSIFLEEFEGAAAPFTAADPDWDQVGFTHFGQSNINRNGDSTATAEQSATNDVSFAGSRLLDFSSTPTEWVAAARFRVDTALVAYHRPSPASHREFALMRGAYTGPAGNPPPSLDEDIESIQAFDIRLDVHSGTSGAVESPTDTYTSNGTFELGWHGHTQDAQDRASVDIPGGNSLTEDAFYTVTVHRKPNDTVDIWLDNTMIQNRPILGTGNPSAIMFGNNSENFSWIGVTYDYITIGAVVPEPTSLVLLLFGTFGLAACRWRRRHRS
jgi:hypothetical protein